jgi:hypothetical protein
MRYLVPVFLLFLAVATAGGDQTAVNSKVAEFVLQDQYDKPVNIRQYEGSIVVLIGSDSEAIKQNEAWEQSILKKYRDNVVLLRVADVRGAPPALKDFIKKKFQERERRSILLDWDGAIFTTYGLRRKISNVILIDRMGYIRYVYSGAAESPAIGRLFNKIEECK